MAAETSQTLHRGLRVLEELADSDTALSITELARRLQLSRTVLYRLVVTLEQHGLIRRDDQGLLHVGLGVLRLAAAAEPTLRDAAMPLLRTLAEAAGATAHLTVAEGDEAWAVAVVEPTSTDVHVSYRVGVRHRLAAGAAGQAILLGRQPQSGPDHVVTSGELQPGAHGLAVPLRGVSDVEASIGIISIGAAVDVERIAPLVLRAASDLVRRLRGETG